MCIVELYQYVPYFQTAPTIFTQIFTILGAVPKISRNPDANPTPNEVAVPFVYALLTQKSSDQYEAVLEAIQRAAEEYNIDINPATLKFMSDFELAILKACTTVFPIARRSCCHFHLGQSLYRRIQGAGLQEAYNDPDNRQLKLHTHMILALAFVPADDVRAAFKVLREFSLADLDPIFSYFNENYIDGRPGRGRRRPVPPRYAIPVWNQFDAARTGAHRTNNVSEGWHNRFRLVVGRNHPDVYSLVKEFQKEQADSESTVAELSLGKTVKAAPKKKWVDAQARIRYITGQYQEYKERNDIWAYLETIGSNITIT